MATTRTEQEAVIDSLASRISLGRPMGPAAQNTFEVSFNDVDPQVAHNVVRILLDTFMEDSLGLKRTDTAVAQRFLESQIKEYESRLVEAEDRLAAFKQQNVGALPGSAGDYYQRLETEMGTLQQLRQTYSQMQMRRDELARQLEGEEPTFGLMGSTEGNPIDGQIARFKAQRDQLLLQYTEKHPNIQSLRNRIEQLEALKASGGISSGSTGAGVDSSGAAAAMNPIYQNTKIALGATEAEMAEVRSQIGNQRAQVEQLRGMIDRIPQVEAELKRLDRNYDVNKRQYDSLVQRLESANLSTEAEQTADSVKFRVVEPPVVPLAPIGPNRGLLSSLVLVAALAAGLATALLLAQMRPVFTSRDALGRISGLPVLGAITKLTSERFLPWYRTQAALVAGAVGALLVGYFLNLLLSGVVRDTATRLLG
jgi:polysaccharide chain length determinant protein (PEP-CTERM system associated)